MNRLKTWLRNWLFGTEPVVAASQTRDPLKIRNSVVEEEYRHVRPTRSADAWLKVAAPLPNVVPDDAPKLALDSISPIVNMPTDYNPMVWFGDGDDDLLWLGYPYLSMLAQRSEYRMIVDTYAREMTREWIELTTTGDDDKSERLADLADKFDRVYGARDLARQLIRTDGFFGRAHLNVRTKGDNDRERKTPLRRDSNKVGKGSLLGFTVIEPLWTYPATYNASEPLEFDFYRPQSWYVLGKEVHGSRLLTVVSRPVPDLLKPAYSFGGMSMTQLARPYVDNWLRSRQSGSDLLHSFSTLVLKTNMSDVLQGGASDMLSKRAQLFNTMRDNRNLLVLDKTEEEFDSVNTPINGVDKMVAQAQEQMASPAGMPLIVLFGMAPSGLNATADGELEVWAQRIAAEQEAVLRPTLQTMLELVQLSEYGEIDETISFRFNPLRELSALDESTIRKNDSDAAAALVMAGIIAPEDERTRLARSKNSIYNGIDLSTPVLPEMDDAGIEDDTD